MALGVAAIRPQFVPTVSRLADGRQGKAAARRQDHRPSVRHGRPRPAAARSPAARTLNRQIKEYIELYAKLANRAGGNNKFGLPVQILGNHIMSGKAEKESDVFEAWEKHLGVTRP